MLILKRHRHKIEYPSKLENSSSLIEIFNQETVLCLSAVHSFYKCLLSLLLMVKAVGCVVKFSRVESGKGFFHIKVGFGLGREEALASKENEIFLSLLAQHKNETLFTISKTEGALLKHGKCLVFFIIHSFAKTSPQLSKAEMRNCAINTRFLQKLFFYRGYFRILTNVSPKKSEIYSM